MPAACENRLEIVRGVSGSRGAHWEGGIQALAEEAPGSLGDLLVAWRRCSSGSQAGEERRPRGEAREGGGGRGSEEGAGARGRSGAASALPEGEVAEVTFRISNTGLAAVKKLSCGHTPNFKPLIFSCAVALYVRPLRMAP